MSDADQFHRGIFQLIPSTWEQESAQERRDAEALAERAARESEEAEGRFSISAQQPCKRGRA